MIDTLKIGTLALGTTASGYLLDRLSGFGSPSVKVDIKERGSFHGADLGVHYYGRRVFGIELTIYGTSKTDYESKRLALETACDIYGGTTTLTILTKSGLELVSEAIATTEFDSPYEKGNMVFSSARLELTAPFPFLKGAIPQSKIVSVFAGGGFAIPYSIPMDMSAGTSVIDICSNAGNAVSFPIITLHGALEDPVLTNETTGDQMSFDYDLPNGSYITIDVYNRTILLNDTTNMRSYLTGDWITLAAGDNYIKLAATSFDGDGKAIFNYRDSYLGI